MLLINQIFKSLQATDSQTETAPYYQRFSSNNKFGIELELENVPNELWSTNFRFWKVVSESSLRSAGAEFVLKEPLNGAMLFRAIGELFNNELLKECDPSWRCGIHIHIDVRSWSLEKFIAFNTVYLAREMELFSKYGQDRLYSNFCIPFNFQPEMMRYVFSGDILAIPSAGCKYSALNYRSIKTFGSVEWRAANATTSSAIMREMISDFCDIIVEAETYLEQKDKDEYLSTVLFPSDVSDKAKIIKYFSRTQQNRLKALTRRFNPPQVTQQRAETEAEARDRIRGNFVRNQREEREERERRARRELGVDLQQMPPSANGIRWRAAIPSLGAEAAEAFQRMQELELRGSSYPDNPNIERVEEVTTLPYI